MRNKLLQKAAVLLIVVTMIFALSGCSNSGSASGKNTQGNNPQKNVTLTIEASQNMKTNDPYDFYQPNIDAFEKKYPNIKVKVILDPDAQTKSILQTKLAAGQPSDIIVYNKVSAENELDAQNNFVDLSGEPWVKNLTNPSTLKSPNGKIYGFSLKNMVGGMGIIYNKDIFKKLNISVPTTWDQFLAACKKIKANGINPIYGPYKTTWTFQMWTTAAWGYYEAKIQPGLWNKINTNQVKWSDVPAFQDSLTKLDDLYKKGYMEKNVLSDDYNTVPQAFKDEKNAMMMGSDPMIPDIEKASPTSHFGLFPVPMFKGESNYLTVAQLDGVFYISKQSKHIKEAKEFLDFMAQPQQINAAQKAQPFAPDIKGANPPKFSPLLQELYTKYNKPGNTVTEMNANLEVDLTELWNYYQDMFAGVKTPKQVLQAWNTKFDSLMKARGATGF